MHDLSDHVTQPLVWLMVIFSPWAFGTTQEWAIGLMNAGGHALGVLYAMKWLARRADRYCFESQAEPGRRSQTATRLLGGVTILLLAYCLVSALNARCTYLGDYQYKYFQCSNWLPHSYDARLTWQTFWNYLALALDFWAIREWLSGLDRSEQTRMDAAGTLDTNSKWFLPRRMRALLWVLSINGAVLAAQGLLQRVIGGGKLLWLVEPHIHKQAEAQFGPYAYRSNAAQYFLLLWPVVFGFWQLLSRVSPVGRKLRMHNHLLPCILLMAIVPLISLSRAGAIIGIWAILAVIIVARGAGWAGGRIVLPASLLLGVAVLLGVCLGGESLTDRFRQSPVDVSRLEIWRNTWQAFKQAPVFGTGPGTFSSVYAFYSSGADQGIAQAHNDWLELLLTFGIAGSVLVAGALVLVLAQPFWNERIYCGRSFPRFIYISLGSCLLYAVVDFPLTIYSILFLFVVNCAVLSSVSARGQAGGD
jgi:O-antigen ligase